MNSNRYALVDESGLVANIILWDGNLDTWQPPNDYTAIELAVGDPAGPGDTLADGVFTHPEPPPPNVELDQAVAVIGQLRDPDQPDPPQADLNAAFGVIAAAAVQAGLLPGQT